MKLTIVRHGQTKANTERTVQGHSGGALDTQGIKQAQQVALRLQDETFDAIYVSDLDRAVQTAKEILQFHTTEHIIYIKELRERNWGELEGTSRENVPQEIKKSSFSAFKPKGGESLMDVQHRIKTFYDTLLEKHFGQSVLIVAHAGVISALLLKLLDKEVCVQEYLKVRPDNTSVTRLEVSEDKSHKVHLLNCTKHLSETPLKSSLSENS